MFKISLSNQAVKAVQAIYTSYKVYYTAQTIEILSS